MDSADLTEGVRPPRNSDQPFRIKYLEQGDSVWLMAHDGTEFSGKVVGRDKRNLLVVIRMDEGHPALPSLTLGDSDAVPMGATALSLGNSLDSILVDRVVSFSYGTVSGSYRFEPIDVMRPGADDTHGDPYKGNILEVDVAIHQGDHGGPVLNLDGQVVGMMTGHYMAGRFLGCAVPSNQIRAVLPQLKKGIKEDELAGPYLGFTLKGVEDDPVITISKVRAGGPADKAGIRAGMQLVRVDNFRIPRFGLIREMLGIGEIKRIIEPTGFGQIKREENVSHGLPVGTHIQLTVRDPKTGQETTVDLVVGEREEDF
jgi:serine protease Do